MGGLYFKILRLARVATYVTITTYVEIMGREGTCPGT